ncbi:MAG: glycosyltransferase family 2 protein, partial [Selenomonadaceae bacterium]|nr:glycosyltransferase family 2 protein [Selenomonadaceae bacterium]
MKVSVIIPVYNAEKFLPICLESLAIQTFTDFEVIIVDDCSTDSSLAVAESYLERFDGRLKIFSLPTNTGSGAIPRNEGLKFSRGEYIFFMDSDDMLVADGLAELYGAAKNFRADVVHMSRGFICSEDLNPARTIEADWDKILPPSDVPMLETNDFAERVEKMFATAYGWAPWIKFLRRDFLIANDIKFPELRISEDVIWTIELVCLAERWIRFPKRLYIYRTSDNSMMRSRRSAAEEIKFWLDPLMKGVDGLDKFLSDLKFFVENPAYRFKVTNFFVKMQLAGMLGALDELSDAELYEIFHRELSKVDGKHAALISN